MTYEKLYIRIHDCDQRVDRLGPTTVLRLVYPGVAFQAPTTMSPLAGILNPAESVNQPEMYLFSFVRLFHTLMSFIPLD